MANGSFGLGRLLDDSSNRPPHRPRAVRAHLATEYEEIPDPQVAHELRRHLRGRSLDLFRFLRSQNRA